MNHGTSRRLTKGLVPLGVLLVALAGCGSSAPGAAPVDAADAPMATATTDQADAAPSIPTVQPTSEATTPSPTRTPGQCFDDVSSSDVKAGSDTTIKPYGTKLTASSSGTKTAITVGQGKPVPADDIFGAQDGDQMLVFDVTGTLVEGSFGMVSSTQFTLWDPAGNACKPDLLSSAVKSGSRLSLKMLKPDDNTVKGKISFEVPKGKDYSGFTLVWANDSADETAAIGWKG